MPLEKLRSRLRSENKLGFEKGFADGASWMQEREWGAKEREKLLSFSRAFKFTLPSKWANIEAHLGNFGLLDHSPPTQ